MIIDKVHVRNKEKRKGVAILGMILIILTLVGALTVASKVIDLGVAIIGDESRKEEMERVVYPMVMMDPAPMVKMDRAEDTVIVQASLWYCLMSEDNTKYETAQGGLLSIPQVDVEYYCARLFGEYYKPVHQTVGDYDTTYTYNAEDQCYYVPVATKSGFYTPKIESFERQGSDMYYVRVGYIAPGPVWSGTTQSDIENAVPDKYMQYVLQRVGDHFIIVSINEDPHSVNTQLPSSTPNQEQQSQPDTGDNV